MTSFVDFAVVKEHVSFASAIELLDLKLKQSGSQWRGPCPVCHRAGDRALVITEGRGFYCWGVKKGGDVIALAAHVLTMGAKNAATELAERAGIAPAPQRNSTSHGTSSRDSPRERGGEETEKLQPLSYLEADHDAVVAIGFDPDFCARHGIGYAPRGIMRGTVAVPIRDEQGELLGYIGIEDARLPSDFQSKVVSLEQKRA